MDILNNYRIINFICRFLHCFSAIYKNIFQKNLQKAICISK